MNAAVDLLYELRLTGVRLESRGDRLYVEAKPGVITPELRAKLTQNKPVLMRLLSADSIRATLLALADAEAIDSQLIHRLTTDDLDGCADLPVETLRAYVRALRDSDLRERGKVPPDETAPAMCHSCGPIWIAPQVAAIAPVVDGWARVLGCPWCHIKDRQVIPRPPVMCGECRHFTRDKINPHEGMGRCSAGCDPDRPWPEAKQQCPTFNPTLREALAKST